MSNAYTSDGRRRSSITHSTRGHNCSFCDKVSFGNGGQVSHGRAHVRRGEAVELVKHYGGYPPTTSRMFLAPDSEKLDRWMNMGFEQVEPTP